MSIHWEHRVTRKQVWLTDDYFEYAYGIREVYYDGDRVLGWDQEPKAPFGETVADLNADFLLMADAFDRPVLDITDEDNPKDVTE